MVRGLCHGESVGICCMRMGRCLSLAMSLPEGLVTSAWRQQPCLQWEEAATGALDWGVGVAPGILAKLRTGISQPRPGTRESRSAMSDP